MKDDEVNTNFVEEVQAGLIKFYKGFKIAKLNVHVLSKYINIIKNLQQLH